VRPIRHRRSRRARAAIGLFTTVLLAGVIVTGAVASAGSLDDAEVEIAALRAQADEASAAYLDTLARAQALETQIAEIEARLPELAERRHELRDRAKRRAVAAYMHPSNQLSPILGATDVLTLMRRTHLLDQLNAQDHDAFADLARVTEQLEAQRAQLQQVRQAQQSVLDELQAHGRDIDAKLQAAEDRARQLRAQPPRPVNPTGTGGAPPTAPVDYTPTGGAHPRHNEPFLVCTRTAESHGNYSAYNPAGPYMGAYQFLQSTWNSTANHAGRPELIGVPPHTASEYDQDDMAWALFQRSGSRPWGGRCD
jgi:hypothetical protein